MASIEAQIIEGGTGDILVLSAKLPDGKELTTSLTSEYTLDRDKEKIWKKGEPRQVVTSGRINWANRDVDWADKKGFRGAADVEAPIGEIVNISSIDGFKAHPANAHYAASKAAVISLTRSLALEVAPLGILVNSVAPGPMATETAKGSGWYAPMVAGLPTRTPIEPAEIANLVAYLSAELNVSVAGENIVVSGAGVIVMTGRPE